MKCLLIGFICLSFGQIKAEELPVIELARQLVKESLRGGIYNAANNSPDERYKTTVTIAPRQLSKILQEDQNEELLICLALTLARSRFENAEVIYKMAPTEAQKKHYEETIRDRDRLVEAFWLIREKKQ